MIEKVILDYLSDALDVPVYLEMPEQMPSSFVLIERTGGGETNLINRATFICQSYATSLYKAAQLNEALKTALRAAPASAAVFRAKLNSDYAYTDPDLKRHRYQAVFEFTY